MYHVLHELPIESDSPRDFSKEFVLSKSFYHSHKKRKDSLEGSLDRILFAAELEFPKIIARRLPQHTSNVNTECARKSEW